MAPKRVLPSLGVRSAAKKSRKTLTLEKKMEVLDMYKKGLKTSAIVKTMGLNESTLRCIRNNETKIRASVKAGSTLRSSHSRPPIMGKMEKLLSTWIDHRNRCNVPVSMKLVQAKAKCIYDDLKKDDKKPFTASSGWFANFRKRYGYHNINGTREVAASAKKPGSEYSAILKTIIEEGDYSSKQVFNIDETGLYWKKLPETYMPVEETTAAGFKSSKDRLTVMFGCNAEGDCKLKPVLIYHSENPRAQGL
ncbi:tigger transposable element-derived protein 1-like isoform X2 [Portunus trituberculatus]|uniref:tigger transposable element-derived protein 1-like isoform X2 n=1 Tax=Portunus trituberculatus TaxID=210409 RepID=UPI001E1D1F3A|nr:tigger transposable element-derived protein 1-like isoform X2 [Portunus trituberculatus]XP_045115642.1 tigger transposable element-derived protein 1-like isoform X2 [Portunus trituberculatus]